MDVLTTAEALSNVRQPVLVPTMGALHEGHAALIRQAAAIAGQSRPVLATIFVNPTQFGPGEDFARYPRPLDDDLAVAEAAGATAVFAPPADVIYPPGEHIPAPPLPAVATKPQLEDAHRPGHFAGVCQVVARLLDLTRPSAAIFGEKDYQQLLVIRAMVEQQQADAPDRWPGLQITSVPTVREPDGLALSSRNAYLNSDERRRALGLSQALRAAQHETTPGAAEQLMHDVLNQHALDVDYAVARDAHTLMPTDDVGRSVRLLIAARCGSTRLIDNAPLAR